MSFSNSGAKKQARQAARAAKASFDIISRQLDLTEATYRHFQVSFMPRECEYSQEAFTSPAYIERPATPQGRMRIDAVMQTTAQMADSHRGRNRYRLGAAQEFEMTAISQQMYAFLNSMEVGARMEHAKRDSIDDFHWGRKMAAVRIGRNIVTSTASQLSTVQQSYYGIALAAGAGYAASMTAAGIVMGRVMEGINQIVSPRTEQTKKTEEMNVASNTRSYTNHQGMAPALAAPTPARTFPLDMGAVPQGVEVGANAGAQTFPADVSLIQGVPLPPTQIR